MGYIDKIDHRDANRQTSCHLAALNGEVECIKTLLEQGKTTICCFYYKQTN